MKNMYTSFQKKLLILLMIISQSGFGQSQVINTEKTVAIDRTETCRSNPKHSYQVFVPSVPESFKQLPLLVSIDPHGDGKLAVAGFKEAAQKYQAVVVGSNLIKNNDASYIQELEELIADVKSRYPVGNILFVGGFSGGARMAIGYATNHTVDGVIAYGALAPAKQVAALSCKVISVIGLDDFNFIEVAPFVIDPQQMPSNLLLETTEATHEWPQKSVMQQTLGFLLLSTMPPGTPAEKRKMVQEFTVEQRKRIDNLTKAGNNLQAALITRNMFGNPYFEREGSFLNLFDQLSNDPTYLQQVDKLSQSIQFETNIRNGFYSALVEKDSVWWKQDVDMLNSKIYTEKDEFKQLAYKRIKGFLGILCYSMCERFSTEKDAGNLEKVLTVYRMAEPKNPEVQHFSKNLEKMKTK